MTNICKTLVLGSVLAGLASPALCAGEVVGVDFSPLPTLSPYGRFRGATAQPEPGKTYPSKALDRRGEWTAMRFGTANAYMTVPGFQFEPGKPFAVEMWLRVYSDNPHGFIIDAGFGYRTGFRLTTVYAKYAPDGWITLICGDGESSKGLTARNGTVDAWHHVVVTQDGDVPVLYVDGVRATAERPEHLPQRYVFAKKPTPCVLGSTRGTPDMKIDGFAIHGRALSHEEVKARYEQGKAPIDDELERQFAQIKLDIPKKTQGYFTVNETIPVTVSAPASFKADAVVVNGRTYRPDEKIALTFGAPCVTEIKIELKAQGRLLRDAVYPIAVIPPPKGLSIVGFNSIAARTPAAYALGARLSREAISWAAIEPKKGEYDWLATDRFMKWNRARGIEVVFCLRGVPGWAKMPQDEDRRRKLWKILYSRYDLKFSEDEKSRPDHVTAGGSYQRIPGDAAATWIREEKASAENDIRALVRAFAKGAKNWFAASGPDEYFPNPNGVDGRPGWKGVAYGVFNSFVAEGAVLRAAPSRHGLTAIHYRNTDGCQGLIVFAEKGSVAFASPVDATGLFGEKLPRGTLTVGTAPVYLPGVAGL